MSHYPVMLLCVRRNRALERNAGLSSYVGVVSEEGASD